MIRRKAALVGTGEQGWCLGWLIKRDSNIGEEMTFVFESGTTQNVTEQAPNAIKFLDGQPEIIPSFE